jgi:DNA (cytosine-5)-methyltransferase 1
MSAETSKLGHMFDFVDLFAGVGGFHAALASLGGRGVQAAEIDVNAARVYEQNWGLVPDIDVRQLAADPGSIVDHAALTAGFPCQPFSKSGRQLGMTEARGTLFHDIVEILKVKRPPVVMLENVRNIAGHGRGETWRAVVAKLRDAGYRLPDQPLVFSPHLLSPEDGGAPQIRERVYILGVYVGATANRDTEAVPVVENKPVNGWNPAKWSVARHVLLPDASKATRARYVLMDEEERWINIWNEFLARLRPDTDLPGHPLWEPVWRARRPQLKGLPAWKQSYIRRNHAFYMANRTEIDGWRRAHPEIVKFPLSRRKLEWQAQNGPRDLWKLLLQLRPSGIRAKRPTYTPALVAMNQAPIFGPAHRRLTPLEAARLQGFPAGFSFGDQVDALSYKQMGNAINVGAAIYVFRRFVEENALQISQTGELGQGLVKSVLSSDVGPRTLKHEEQTA